VDDAHWKEKKKRERLCMMSQGELGEEQSEGSEPLGV
jgi:hypothetical protein